MIVRRVQLGSYLPWLRPACKAAFGLLLAAIAVVLVEEVQVRNLVGWTSESVVARVPAYALSDCWGWLHCGWGISSERLDVILAMAAVAFTVGIVIKRRHRRKQQASPQ